MTPCPTCGRTGLCYQCCCVSRDHATKKTCAQCGHPGKGEKR